MGRGTAAAPASGIRTASKRSIEIDFYYRGVRCRERLKLSPTPANRRYAANLKAEIQSRIARGTFNYAEFFPDSRRARILSKRPGDVIILREALRRYIDSSQKSLQRSTWLDYKGAVEKHLIPAFGELRLTELTRTCMREWAARLDVSPKRLANVLLPLRAVLADAVEDELIERNPLANWKPTVAAKPREEDVIDPFTVDEIQAILRAAEAPMSNMIQFGFWTGLRISELLAIAWRDVDWRRDVVRIRRALVRGEVKVTKTEAGTREVTLLEPAKHALQAQRASTELRGGPIFTNPRTGDPWLDDQQLRKGFWERILRRAGVRYRYPNQMRHTYASTMLSAGENPAWIASQMGHRDWGMIRRTYARWLPSADPHAGSRAVALWGGKGARSAGSDGV